MTIEKVTILVQGVTCISCASYIERAIYRIDGVLVVQVNLVTEKTIVAYINGVADPTDLRRAVTDAGYVVRGVVKWGTAARDPGVDEEEPELITSRVHMRLARWVAR